MSTTPQSVTRTQLTFALSVFLALPLAVASQLVMRPLLARTEAGRFLESGGSIETSKLDTYYALMVFGALVTLALGIMACSILARLILDYVYGRAQQQQQQQP